MSSLFEIYEAEQLHGGSANEEISGSNSAENSSKSNIDWTQERKLKLALACQLYKGHIDEKGSKNELSIDSYFLLRRFLIVWRFFVRTKNRRFLI